MFFSVSRVFDKLNKYMTDIINIYKIVSSICILKYTKQFSGKNMKLFLILLISAVSLFAGGSADDVQTFTLKNGMKF